jgi:hypothetical protein
VYTDFGIESLYSSRLSQSSIKVASPEKLKIPEKYDHIMYFFVSRKFSDRQLLINKHSLGQKCTKFGMFVLI